MQVWGRQDNIQDCNRMSKTDEETIKPWRWSVDNQLVGAFVSGVGWSQHSPRCCGGIRKKKVIVSIPSEFAVYKILGDLRKNTGKAPAEDRMTKCYLLLNWPVGFRHLESLADINIFSTEGDCTFKSTAQENISVCQVSAKPSWKKNIQQISPARGPNLQSLSQMINDICQLTKQMASTIWGHGPAVQSTPVEPAESTLRWEKASLCKSPLERKPGNKQP